MKALKKITEPVSGLEAVSLGLKDGGCELAFNFPGFKSHKIFAMLGGEQISLNEKIAYEEAFGASLAGKRSVVSFKNVGLNVAADSYMNSLISGVNAGMVVVVTEDTDVSDSQNRMDSRHYFDFYGGLWLEPFDCQSGYDLAYKAFEWSEKFRLPVVIRLTSQFFESEGEIKRQKKATKKQAVAHDHAQFIVHPTNWKQQSQALAKKKLEILKLAEKLHEKAFNGSNARGVIVAGNCNREMALLRFTKYDTLRVMTYPLPLKKIKSFIDSKKQIAILEQGDEYCREKIDFALFKSKKMVDGVKNQIPDLGNTYRVWGDLEKLFKAVKSVKPGYVVSDLTQFTRESTDTIDCCLCMGSSVAVGIGMSLAGVRKPICIAGDTSFMHCGTDVVKEALQRKASLDVVIVDNGGSWCTGGQKPIDGQAENLKQVRYFRLDYDKSSEGEITTKIREMQKKDGISMLYVTKK